MLKLKCGDYKFCGCFYFSTSLCFGIKLAYIIYMHDRPKSSYIRFTSYTYTCKYIHMITNETDCIVPCEFTMFLQCFQD